MFTQLVLAIHECHRRTKPLLHRNIIPESIYLDEDYNIKLGNFTLAKYMPENELEKTTITFN